MPLPEGGTGAGFPRRNTRGIALPLVLVGLIVTSLLVTALLLTSSVELATSTSHQDATVALYRAEAGLQAYIADVSAGGGWVGYIPPSDTIDYLPVGAPPEDAVRIWVTRVATAGSASPATVYSLLATPVAGSGRTMSVFVEVNPTVPSPNVFGWLEVIRGP